MNKENNFLVKTVTNHIHLLGILIFLIPIIYLLSFISWLHEIPNNDYWNHFFRSILMNLGNWSLMGKELFSKSNEHFIVIPKIMYFINYLISRGNNIGLFIENIIVVLITAIFSLRILRMNRTIEYKEIFYMAPLISLFLFSPAASHNWIWAMSGIAWFTANLFFVITVWYFAKFTRGGEYFRSMIGMALFSFLGAISYGTGVFIFIIVNLFLFLYVLRKREALRYAIVYFVLSAIFFVVWVKAFKVPHWHPDIDFKLTHIGSFMLAFLGNLFTSKIFPAQIVGGVGVLLTTVIMVFFIKKFLVDREDKACYEIAPWLMFCLYTLFNTFGAAATRYGFGLETALAGRYANLTLLFWLGIVMSMFMVTKDVFLKRKGRVWATSVVSILTAILLISLTSKGLDSKNNYTELSKEQELSALSLQLGIYDKEYLEKIVSWDPRVIISIARDIKRVKHVPMDKMLVPEFSYDKQIETAFPINSNDASPVTGLFDKSEKIEGSKLRVKGWAISKNKENKIEYILILNQENRLRGAAILGYRRPDVKKHVGDEKANYCGWKGYARKSKNSEILRAVARLSDGSIVMLNNAETLEPEG